MVRATHLAIGLTALLLWTLSTQARAESANQSSHELLKWSELPPLPDPYGFAAPIVGVADGALVVSGGTNFPDGRPWDGATKVWHDRIFVLRNPDGEWQALEQRLPRPLAGALSLTVPAGILVIGGGDQAAHYRDVYLLRLDGEKIRIEEFPPLPKPLALASGAVLGNAVYIAGGISEPFAMETSKAFYALDWNAKPTERSWRELESWPGPGRMLPAAAAQDGGFYLFGGVDLAPGPDGTPVRTYLTDAYRYEPKLGWRQVRDLPRHAAAAATPAPTLGNAHVLLLGGDTGELASRVAEIKNDHPGFSREILAYHTITDTWATSGNLPRDLGPDPANRPNEGRWPPAVTGAVWWRDRLVVPSGEVRPGVRTPRVLAATTVQWPSHFYRLDYVVLAGYLGSLVAIGLHFARRENTTADFFLGGQRIPWWAAGLSIFGTQLSALTFMAVPALVFATDWVYFIGSFLILLMAPVVIYLYLPFYRRLGVTTIYQYLEWRFNPTVRVVGSLAFMTFQLSRMGIMLFLPALALSAVTQIDIYLCIGVMGVLATFYTVLGGIEAVIWTDVIQVVVLLCGAIACLLVAVTGIDGGLETVVREGLAAGKFRGANWNGDYTTTVFWVVILGRFFEQLMSYTSDQTVAQRYLTTPTERQAARSIWTNGLMSVPSTLLFFMIGTTLWVYYRHHPELLAPTPHADDIFPLFIARELPRGISGLVIAGLFAASMSSLDSVMNSVATAITTDLYPRFRAHATDQECLRLAKWLTLLIGCLGTGVAMYLAGRADASIYNTFLKAISLFSSGLAGLFVTGIFTRRTTGPGALIGFLASAAILYAISSFTEVHFFLYAGIGVVSCTAIAWLASFALPAREKSIEGLTIYSMPTAA
jgi:SSS family transporter